MSALFGERVILGQANGPDVELIVSGDEWYASYQTVNGFPAIYDEGHGLFCYARLVGGAFVSTGVAVTDPPPPDVEPKSEESGAVRQAKAAAAQRRRQTTAEQRKEPS